MKQVLIYALYPVLRWPVSILVCLLTDLCILQLISNPDCLAAPVIDLLFIIIGVAASNPTDWNPLVLVWQGCESRWKTSQCSASQEFSLLGSGNIFFIQFKLSERLTPRLGEGEVPQKSREHANMYRTQGLPKILGLHLGSKSSLTITWIFFQKNIHWGGSHRQWLWAFSVVFLGNFGHICCMPHDIHLGLLTGAAPFRADKLLLVTWNQSDFALDRRSHTELEFDYHGNCRSFKAFGQPHWTQKSL